MTAALEVARQHAAQGGVVLDEEDATALAFVCHARSVAGRWSI